MLTRSTGRRLVLAATVAAATLAASTASAQAVELSQPTVTPIEASDHYVLYRVSVSAVAGREYTRWQGQVRVFDQRRGRERSGIDCNDGSLDHELSRVCDTGVITLEPGRSYRIFADWQIYNLCGADDCRFVGRSPAIVVDVPLDASTVCDGVPGCVDKTNKNHDDGDGLEADAGGPYHVTRGRNVRLNGSRSKGKITEYVWTFGPAQRPGEPDPNEPFCENPRFDAERKGKTARAVVVCPVTVILTVRDKKGRTDTDTAPVFVRARPFKRIPFRHRPTPLRWKAPFTVTAGTCQFNCSLGKNLPTRVARKGGTEGTYYIEGAQPKLRGYKLARVNDRGGPFHGYYYVGSHSLKVDRSMLVQAELWPRSATRKENARLNVERARLGLPAYDPGLIFESVKAHEKIHSDLIAEKLKQLQDSPQDPVTHLEGVARADRELMIAQADTPIVDANVAIGDYAEPHDVLSVRMTALGFGVPGLMVAPTGARNDYGEWTPSNLALLGD